ncbi:unnamed protein product [Coccothraustes coccothraustes]
MLGAVLQSSLAPAAALAPALAPQADTCRCLVQCELRPISSELPTPLPRGAPQRSGPACGPVPEPRDCAHTPFRGRRSPRRLRELRARNQAGDEGASPACAGRPEPLPGPGDGNSIIQFWAKQPKKALDLFLCDVQLLSNSCEPLCLLLTEGYATRAISKLTTAKKMRRLFFAADI